MTTDELVLANVLFQNKIYKSNDNEFEKLFTQIMKYAEPEFEQIKPWGNIGDRKNDGFIRSKGIFYQVYAPEDIRNNYPQAVSKLKTDFHLLIQQWSPVYEFYFVINDKYLGINADCSNEMSLIVTNNSLKSGKMFVCSDLENVLFNLADRHIISVVGFIPQVNLIENLKFSVLDIVIDFIINIKFSPVNAQIKYPDWDEKIQFNCLSEVTKNYLNIASFQLGDLNEFLINQSQLASLLQTKMTALYESLKKEYEGDSLFWEMVENCYPDQDKKHIYLNSIIVIMAKYFESCDIFEEPIKTD